MNSAIAPGSFRSTFPGGAMRARLVSLSVCLGLFALGGAVRDSGGAPIGCMKCHGNEAAMKAMVKPVIPVSAEGEG